MSKDSFYKFIGRGLKPGRGHRSKAEIRRQEELAREWRQRYNKAQREWQETRSKHSSTGGSSDAGEKSS